MKAKLVLLGVTGVGKTSLIRRFVVDQYSDDYVSTLGTKVSKVQLNVPYGADIEVQMDLAVFDIMGQGAFKDMVRETYYHGAQALMAVVDLTRKETLSALTEWIPSAVEVAGDVPLYIVVNKKDLEGERAFTDDEIRGLAESFGASYAYASARSGDHVEEVFHTLAIEIVKRAFRQVQETEAARALREKVLVLLEKRGTLGLRRIQFFQILKGVNFDELQNEIKQLEGEGLVALLWHGPADFTAIITARGARAAKLAPAWDQG